jgi:anti-sigma regulatory factor (Ser/Thr protein kinase)
MLSVKDDLLVLARLAISTVASRAGFDIEEVDDLRLAVDELCLLVLRGRRDGRVLLAFAADAGRIDVWCTYEGREPGPDEEAGDVAALAGLSGRILDALVDEHGPSVRDGLTGAHMCKRRVRADG